MKKTYPLFLIIALGLLTAAVLTGGAGVSIILDPASFVFVFGLTVSVSLMGCSFGEMGAYFAVVFKSADEADATELRKAARYFRSLRTCLALSGLCGTMTGIIVMLSVLSDDTMAIGRGMALALITLFYSLILILVVAVPFEQAAGRLLAEKGE